MARTSKKATTEKPVVEEVKVEEVAVTEEPVKEIPKKCVVMAAKLNIRKGPGIDTVVVDLASMGDVLNITMETPQFFGIKTANGTEGFVMKSFVNVL